MIIFVLLLLLMTGVVLFRYLHNEETKIESEPERVSDAVSTAPPNKSEAKNRNETETAATAGETAAEEHSGQTSGWNPGPETAASNDPSLKAQTVPAVSSGVQTAKRYDEQTYQLVTDLIFTMRNRGESDEAAIRDLLEELKRSDEELGTLWESITDYWLYVSRDLTINTGKPPEGLPEDDSLGIAVLGFQLMYDGTMAPELIGRLETALACAKKYPNAWLIVTGGGTAFGNRQATEAGVMAEWLAENGIAREKIIVENRSLTTDQNATYSCEILAEQYPQIRQLLMVSSDYHVALGSMLFTEAALLYAYEHDCETPYQVVSNAGYATTGNPEYSNPMKFTSDMWIMADPEY